MMNIPNEIFADTTVSIFSIVDVLSDFSIFAERPADPAGRLSELLSHPGGPIWLVSNSSAGLVANEFHTGYLRAALLLPSCNFIVVTPQCSQFSDLDTNAAQTTLLSLANISRVLKRRIAFMADYAMRDSTPFMALTRTYLDAPQGAFIRAYDFGTTRSFDDFCMLVRKVISEA